MNTDKHRYTNTNTFIYYIGIYISVFICVHLWLITEFRDQRAQERFRIGDDAHGLHAAAVG
jgi:hypothetical protein